MGRFLCCRWVRSAIVICSASALICLAALLPVRSQEGGEPATIARSDVDTCLACHASATEKTRPVDKTALDRSPHAGLVCQDCHSSITAAPHTAAMLEEKASCATCHPDQEAAYAKGLHSNPDKQPGDHPTCVFCHGCGDPHAIGKADTWTRPAKVALCSNCHRDRTRMRRYGPDTDAVGSYQASFHGKALLRYGNYRVAICSDCHGHHDVLSPDDPAAPTNRANAAKTCGQAGCHHGAKVNFAMSGANHLSLKVKAAPILRIEEWFFYLLTAGTLAVLLLGIALDLRREVFDKEPPKSGRPAGIAISLSFLCMVATLVMSSFGIPGRRWPLAGAAVLFVLAFILRLFHRKATAEPLPKGKYLRLTVAQRLQHAALALSFSGLVLSGMPLRYADIVWVRQLYLFLGGMVVMRVVHRVCGVIMIATWIWHTIYLLYRWKKAGFSLNSWTMFPTRKDFRDFFATALYYLHLTNELPKYDRFHFKEKFDYFAVYWGMPIMVLSGLVLWFPVALGNILPETAVSAALIAHSDEAVLAFLAIVMWHLYNTHFHPERFPMNPVWLTGTLTEEEMARDHPLELERLKALESTQARGEVGPPEESSLGDTVSS